MAGERVVLYVSPGDAGGSDATSATGATGGIPTFVAGRRVGGAVERNRARRILREAWRILEPVVREEVGVVWVARPSIRGAKTQDLVTEMRELLQRAGVRPR